MFVLYVCFVLRVSPTFNQSIRRALGVPSLQEPLARVQAPEWLRATTGTVNTAIGSVATTAGQHNNTLFIPFMSFFQSTRLESKQINGFKAHLFYTAVKAEKSKTVQYCRLLTRNKHILSCETSPNCFHNGSVENCQLCSSETG